MANSFNKEERVAFEQLLEGFNDALVLSRNVSKYNTDSTEMERAGDTIWRPQPYIAQSYDGMDQTGNFGSYTQLAVPASLGFSKSVPWELDAKEMRDALQENRLFDSAKQKLASDINMAITNVASNQGTLVVAQSTAATGYDDVALAEALMNEQGVDPDSRYMGVSTRDYNGMASNLGNRNTVQGVVQTAYERSFIARIASFDMFKMDYANRLAASTATGVTINGAGQYYTPQATSTASSGERANVDNRYQNLAVTVTSGTIAVGDCITITGVNAVHHITKEDTGQLKTFRVTGIISGGGGTGVIQISAPIISGGGGTDAELQYQNVSATPADGAAISFLNTTAAYVNPFWHRDALEILPGRYAVPTDAGADVMRATTDQGIELVMSKQFDIATYKTKYRVDTLFGVVNKQPEMTGIMLFGQV